VGSSTCISSPSIRRSRKRTCERAASSIYLDKDGNWHGYVTVGVTDNGKPDCRHVKRKTRADTTKAVRALEQERDAGRVRKIGQT
jgi:integrase